MYNNKLEYHTVLVYYHTTVVYRQKYYDKYNNSSTNECYTELSAAAAVVPQHISIIIVVRVNGPYRAQRLSARTHRTRQQA